MERTTSPDNAKLIMGDHFVGLSELVSISDRLPLIIPNNIPEIPFNESLLYDKKDDHILIFGVSEMTNGRDLNIISMRDYFGVDPDISEPCFYNQDWYFKENFVNSVLECKWYLIRKNVFEDSRGVEPLLLEKKYLFPSAVLCAYTFFVYWFLYEEILWKYDFIWCNDIDHNGDRIYVGKYIDIDKVNRNGFSIHRHLSLRNVYASITVI